MPTVSIIIPTYNRADYLALTLESIVQQTYQDFEIIVVDDGTPGQKNANVCSEFEKVKYIKIENFGGPAKPRNIGIKEAAGKYIAFVDDDDIWLPLKLEKQVEILENNPEFGLVHCCCELINESGQKLNRIIGRPGSPDVKHGDVRMRMMGNWTIMMPTPLIRKDVITNAGFFNEIIPPALEDVEYWTRCSFFTKFYYIDEPLVQYRLHSNNISKENKKYADLPVYLRNVLEKLSYEKRINNGQYKSLMKSLCAMQIKMIKKYTYKSACNLFVLDSFWMFKFKNLKLLVFILIKR